MREKAEREARRLRGRMVDGLLAQDLLQDSRWRAAFEDVPRHTFVPWFFEQFADGSWTVITDDDPRWLSAVYDNRVLVTQLDGNESLRQSAVDGPVDGVPTCSSSMPTIMAIMLDALDVHNGQKVLEVGAGTGYNAALLCHRLGEHRVTTVDVDAAIAARAERNLTASGYHPTCVATDGAGGYPANAPYDRVLCTCSVSTIPLPWLEQTAPGGYVVTTLNRPIGAGLLKFTSTGGPSAHGRVLAEDGRFMPLRAHRGPRIGELISNVDTERVHRRHTDLTAGMLLRMSNRFEFFAGLALPQVVAWSAGSGEIWLAHPDGSWASYLAHKVAQGGPRKLWELAESAYSEWLDLGEPRRERFGVTVTPELQEFWLDEQDSPYRWNLAP
jgi:methyltransferase of ATP-grasp peptide maturase system